MFLVGGFSNILRGISVTLCNWIYQLIPQLYSIFYYLADSRFFDSELIRSFSTNIYVLVSVVMLFAFAVKLLQAIVNPDLLGDSKKGVVGVLKRSFIALFLIIIVPFAFDSAYEIQSHVIRNSLIEKILVGIQTSGQNIAESTNAGQVLAGITISGLLYPNDDATTTSDVLQSNYNTMINDDISYMDKVANNINEVYVDSNGNEEYVLHFDPIIALIAGILVVYMFILFCFDTAFRFIKLAFLELTAPISIIAYIYNGGEFLNKWFKETLNTFLALFIRIAALGLLIFGLHQLPTFMEQFGDIKGKFWIELFVIIGLLMFVKSAPDLVKTITGANLKGGGIGRRLGEMAGVGEMAQKAWNGVKNVGMTAAGVAGLGLAAVSSPIGAGVVGGGTALGIGGKIAWEKGLKNTKFGKFTTTAGKATGAFLKAKNPISGISAVGKVINDSEQAKSNQYLKTQLRNEKLRDDSRQTAQTSANIVKPNMYVKDPTTGKMTIDNLVAKNADFSNILGNSKLNTTEQKIIKEYDSARHDKRVAETYNTNFKRLENLLSNAISASTNSVDKQKLLSLQSALNAGNYDVSKLLGELSGINSLKTASGSLNDTAKLINDCVQSIVDSKGYTMSSQYITENLENKTAVFNGKEKTYNGLLDTLSDSEKELIKAYAKVGNDISKAKLKK